MKTLEKIELRNFSAMKIGGQAKYLIEISDKNDLIEAWKFGRKKNLPLFPIGAGTNTIFSDNGHEKIILSMKNTGVFKTYEGPDFVNIEAGAGENWDDLVKWSIENGLSGLETLSGIPGTVGACPIQNIGAYGSEVAKTIISVEFFDIDKCKFYEASNDQCEFSYRDSVFKKNLGKFIITKVAFQLSKMKPEIPQYKDVQLYFLAKKQSQATAEEIRNAILEIRKEKLPDPSVTPNCGSFFKNPIVDKTTLEQILVKYPEMTYFAMDADHSKLYAGWLIERVGLKGVQIGNVRIHNKSSLVITNPEGKANFSELELAIHEIKTKVHDEFGVDLEVEPNIIQ